MEVNFTPVWVRRYFAENRLRMEVIPYQNYHKLEGKLNNQELRILAQVNSDVQEVWSPLKRYNLPIELIKLSKNIYLPGLNINPWVPFFHH